MSNTPTPAQAFTAAIGQIIRALETWRIAGLLAVPLKILVTARIMTIRDHLRRLADHIAAGTYKPRRSPTAPRRKPLDPKPRRPDPLPQKPGWLRTLVPHEMYRLAVTDAGHQLERLLRDDPQMIALIQAAPPSLRRPLRSLCRMLAIPPPPVLALPPRPRRPRQAGQARPEPKPPPHRTDPPPGVPHWLLSAPPGKKPWFPADLYDPPDPETT